jgi:hypothetical protein
MRKFFPKIASFAFLSVMSVLLLVACVKPVGIRNFLDDDAVVRIIKGGGFDIDYEHPKDHVPLLEVPGIGTVNEGDTVAIPRGSGGVTIRVTNEADYDTIEWYYNSAAMGSGTVFSVDTGRPPFNREGDYPVTVVGTTAEGVSYSILFYIVVE